MTTRERVNQLSNMNEAFDKYDMRQFMKFCSVGEFDIIKKTREEEIRMNRQLAGVFGFANGMSLQAIGLELGGIDHATVLHGIRVVYDDFIYGKKMKEYLNIFCNNIENYTLMFSIDLSAALSSLECNLQSKQIQLT